LSFKTSEFEHLLPCFKWKERIWERFENKSFEPNNLSPPKRNYLERK
jgi:hypothetical protein